MPTPTNTDAAAANKADQLAGDALSAATASLDELRDQLDTQPMTLPDLGAGEFDAATLSGIEMLGDVELHVSVELGRTHMLVEDVLRLAQGSIVELDKLAGDPVDVYVNNRLLARGEVLVLNDNFCIRISEIVSDLEDQIHEVAAQVAQPA